MNIWMIQKISMRQLPEKEDFYNRARNGDN